MAVANAAALTLAGAIANGGSIAVNGSYTSPQTKLRIAGAVRLSGGGGIALVDTYSTTHSDVAAINGATAADRLENVDNLISGYGELGSGALTFLNDAAGVVDATVGTLVLDTGLVTIANGGLLEATAGGTLDVRSAVSNTGRVLAGATGTVVLRGSLNGGTVQVAAGGALSLGGAVLAHATLTAQAGGLIQVTSTGTIDATTGTVSLAGSLTVAPTAQLTAKGTITNSGTILLDGSYTSPQAMLLAAGPVTLTGGGTVRLHDSYGDVRSDAAAITGAVSATDSLDNIDNLIVGYGELGSGKLSLTNEAAGTIDAEGATLLVATGAGTLTNHGLLEATAGGTLLLESSLANAGASLLAATGATVQLGAGAIAGIVVGGRVAASGTGSVFVSAAGGTLDGRAQTVTTAGAVTLANTATLTLEGAIANGGSIAVNGSYTSGLTRVRIAGTVTLSGGGAVTLADTYAGTKSAVAGITGTTTADMLDNIDNGISGYGLIGGGHTTFVNEASGVVTATDGTMTIDTGAASIVNHGSLVADGGALVLNSAVDNSGVILAKRGTTSLAGLSGAGTVRIGAGATLDLNGTAAANSTIAFAGTGGTLALGTSPAGSTRVIDAGITGFDPTDVLELAGTSVSGVTFSAGRLTVTTDAGTTVFTNVSYTTPPSGYTASHDAATGLEAIAFTPANRFQQVAQANAGPYAGQYLWSSAANWTAGLPANGSSVAIGAAGFDDIASLTLATLTQTVGGNVVVVGGSLTAGNVVAAAGTQLLALGAAGSTAASVSVGKIAGAGGLFGALGGNARFVDLDPNDPGETYLAQAGGTVQLAAAPNAASTLQFSGAGRFALLHPAATTSLSAVTAGDIVEVPGAAVSALALNAQGVAVFTDLGSYALLTPTSGVTGVTTSHDAATGLESLAFTDQAIAADFNGDRTADQLWQASNGLIIDYGMVRGAIATAAGVGLLGPDTKFLASGDFNGDGTADQLWQASGGALIDYTMTNGAISGAAVIGALGAGYTFLAAADFNGDGTTDMLWQAANGLLVDYSMVNGAIASGAVVGSLDPSFRFLAAGDFNGDGTADQLWQAASGAIVDFAMQGGSIVSAATIGSLDGSWKFLAAADFNGDGTSDMLWQNAGGGIVDFGMHGGAIAAATGVGVLDGTFRFLAAGDFDGDGTADMLWQAASGAIIDYTMHNGAVSRAAIVGALDPSYKFLA